jgi:hypothetical protein
MDFYISWSVDCDIPDNLMRPEVQLLAHLHHPFIREGIINVTGLATIIRPVDNVSLSDGKTGGGQYAPTAWAVGK